MELHYHVPFSVMHLIYAGMNAVVRAVVRMGIYVGSRVYLIKEVCSFTDIATSTFG